MFETSSQWTLVTPPRCGMCGERAQWVHRYSGIKRCDDCPRPECEHMRCEAGTRRCLDCGAHVPYGAPTAPPRK